MPKIEPPAPPSAREALLKRIENAAWYDSGESLLDLLGELENLVERETRTEDTAKLRAWAATFGEGNIARTLRSVINEGADKIENGEL